LVSSKRSSELVSGALKKPASTDAAPTMAYAGADATLPPTSQSGGVVSHPRGLRRKRERFLSSPHTSPFLKSENIFQSNLITSKPSERLAPAVQYNSPSAGRRVKSRPAVVEGHPSFRAQPQGLAGC
jgi:hypothetical protein